MSPSAMEIARADISDTAEIEIVDNRRVVRRPDGSVFFLDTLSDTAYWAYMSRREAAWYKETVKGI